MKRLAQIIKSKSINVIDCFEDSELLEIEKALETISQLYLKNLNLQNITLTFEQIKQFPNANDVVRKITEYLNLSKTFLFHWESEIKDNYSQESIQNQIFKEATSIEYDNYLSYKFLYELRNYIQHCSYPNISTNAKLNNDDSITYKINLDTSTLSEKFKWNKFNSNEKELLTSIDLLKILEENLLSHYRIHNKLINSTQNIELLLNCINLLLYYEKYSENQNLALIEYVNLNGNKFDNLNISIIEFKKIKEIKRNINIR